MIGMEDKGRAFQAEKQLVQRPEAGGAGMFGDSKEVSVTGSERVEGEWQEEVREEGRGQDTEAVTST